MLITVGTWPITWNARWGWIVIECPICAYENVYNSLPQLLEHVWLLHLPPGWVCWCGAKIEKRNRSFESCVRLFGRHCDEHGGLLAHYLECRLG